MYIRYEYKYDEHTSEPQNFERAARFPSTHYCAIATMRLPLAVLLLGLCARLVCSATATDAAFHADEVMVGTPAPVRRPYAWVPDADCKVRRLNAARW